MKRYANEGREGYTCLSYVMDARAARDWKDETGRRIPHGCISCVYFNGLVCTYASASELDGNN